MEDALPILIFIGAVVVGVFLLALWFKAGKKKALQLRADFETAHGLKGSERPGEFGTIYRADGTVRGVAVHIESEAVRGAKGWRKVTRVRTTGASELGALVCVRRALTAPEAGAGANLPQQELGDPEFDDKFRTLCATAGEAGALLSPGLRKILAEHVTQPLFGVQLLEIAGAEITLTMGSSLANGLVPAQKTAVEQALDVVVGLCKGA